MPCDGAVEQARCLGLGVGGKAGLNRPLVGLEQGVGVRAGQEGAPGMLIVQQDFSPGGVEVGLGVGQVRLVESGQSSQALGGRQVGLDGADLNGGVHRRADAVFPVRAQVAAQDRVVLALRGLDALEERGHVAEDQARVGIGRVPLVDELDGLGVQVGIVGLLAVEQDRVEAVVSRLELVQPQVQARLGGVQVGRAAAHFT